MSARVTEAKPVCRAMPHSGVPSPQCVIQQKRPSIVQRWPNYDNGQQSTRSPVRHQPSERSACGRRVSARRRASLMHVRPGRFHSMRALRPPRSSPLRLDRRRRALASVARGMRVQPAALEHKDRDRRSSPCPTATADVGRQRHRWSTRHWRSTRHRRRPGPWPPAAHREAR